MLVHAAGESAYKSGVPLDASLGVRAVVLEAKNEQHLFRIWKKLTKQGIQCVPIVEGAGPYEDQFMAIGVYPTTNSEVFEAMKPFQLLKSCVVDNEPTQPVDLENPNETKPETKEDKSPTQAPDVGRKMCMGLNCVDSSCSCQN
jgi:hypothetical protein